MINKLVELQRILHTHSSEPILPLAVARRFQSPVKGFLHDYSLMANAAEREDVLIFNVAPKHHNLSHLGDRALWLNPRQTCCLLDEDYVGKFKIVVSAWAHGTASHAIPNKVAEHYRCGFFFTLKWGV